jgi:branched-chain amino acid transport system ATP-binding protein
VEAGLCLIPEGRGIFPALSVRDNLRVAAGGESWDAAVELFEVLGSRLDQRAGTLSGGEQQMLAMSRALLRTPRVLLLDELSLGLAPRIVDQLYEAVAAMHQAGSAVVLVEQYVDKALELCDLVAILEGGRIRFAGEPSELDEAGASIGSGMLGGRR